MLGLRADEGDAVAFQDLGETGVFRQEAVAGMDRVGAGDLAGRQQLRNVEVALARRRRADADALVGQLDVHGVGVGGGVDRNGCDVQLLAGAQHPERDLAAIGDQDLVKHGARPAHSMIMSGSPYSTGRPSSNRMRVTVPLFGATMSLKVFIASMRQRRSPSLTVVPTSTSGLASGEGRR